MTAHDDQTRRAAELLGLRPSRARACPRVVAGARCRANKLEEDGQPCLCQRHRHLLDHGRAWFDADGKRVLTGEPYNADGHEIAELVTDMDTLGLRVTISGRSPWNPNETFLVQIAQQHNDD
ncbi:hypothetical protein [Nonomuraea rhizosphaerae]|uniref:hypothetical protein n=1 Tax=Nonomuraea rhizosphaerae TaxID=2665663 RepID=UPI001C5D0B59|nr:hypothetical protein [Nonomuraea rhizosphaerae]